MHTCARANTPLRPPPNPRSATSAAHPLPLSRAARRDSDARSASLTDAGRGAAPVAGVVVRRGRVTTAEPQRATEGGADPAGARGAPSPPPVAYRRLFSFRDLSALWCRLPSPPPSIYGRRWPGWPLDHATTRSARFLRRGAHVGRLRAHHLAQHDCPRPTHHLPRTTRRPRARTSLYPGRIARARRLSSLFRASPPQRRSSIRARRAADALVLASQWSGVV